MSTNLDLYQQLKDLGFKVKYIFKSLNILQYRYVYLYVHVYYNHKSSTHVNTKWYIAGDI